MRGAIGTKRSKVRRNRHWRLSTMYLGGVSNTHAPFTGKAILDGFARGWRRKQYAYLACNQFSFFLVLDYVMVSDKDIIFHVRDQKTTGVLGFYAVKLQYPLVELVRKWVRFVRPHVLKSTNVEHGMVFLNCESGAPFSQQAFSKYMVKAFACICEENLNLQIIRRIFVQGMRRKRISYLTSVFIIGYLAKHTCPTEWRWLATSMLTGVESLKKTYNRDAFQRQAFEKVRLPWVRVPYCAFYLSSSRSGFKKRFSRMRKWRRAVQSRRSIHASDEQHKHWQREDER